METSISVFFGIINIIFLITYFMWKSIIYIISYLIYVRDFFNYYSDSPISCILDSCISLNLFNLFKIEGLLFSL